MSWRTRGPGDQPQAHTARLARRAPATPADGTAARLRAQRPNDVWALVFQFDETADLRRVKLLNIVDEFTREALAVEAADGVVAVERLVAQRGAPAHLRMDNGPELASVALRDWCRIWGTHTAYIEPGSPWENPYIESFNGRLRYECLNTEDFADLLEARVVLEDWRTEYNTYRPHQSLGGLTPAAYADHWTHQHQPTQTHHLDSQPGPLGSDRSPCSSAAHETGCETDACGSGYSCGAGVGSVVGSSHPANRGGGKRL